MNKEQNRLLNTSISTIHAAIEKLGLKVFRSSFSITLGAVRAKDAEANTFNDIIFASYWDNKGKLHSLIIPGTTDAGLSSRLNPTHKLGTAVIQHNKQYRGVYQLQDPELDPSLRGHKGEKAFRQIADMDYWRDNNKDNKIDFKGITYTGIHFTNGHMMGNVGKEVSGWSAGCWGATRANMQKLFNFVQIQLDKGLGDKFSFVLIHENEL